MWSQTLRPLIPPKKAAARLFNLPESFERLSPKGAEKTAVRSVPQSEMALSSPASSPSLSTPWAKTRPCPQTGPTDTLAGRQLLSPACHTAVAALLSGAGEREVKKLNLLTLPVSWCLGDDPLMNGHGAVPETPARGVTALPMTDPPVVSMNSDTRTSEARSQLLAPACRRACEALPDGCRAGRRRVRCVLRM